MGGSLSSVLLCVLAPRRDLLLEQSACACLHTLHAIRTFFIAVPYTRVPESPLTVPYTRTRAEPPKVNWITALTLAYETSEIDLRALFFLFYNLSLTFFEPRLVYICHIARTQTHLAAQRTANSAEKNAETRGEECRDP